MALLFIVALATCAVPSFAGDGLWPAMLVPPKSHVYWVGNDMKVNGIPMKVQGFVSDTNVEEVLMFYRNRWDMSADGKRVESRRNGWQIIGHRDGNYYMTVQVCLTDDNRSHGYLAVSRLATRINSRRQQATFPIMAGSEKVSDVESIDPGKKAHTFMFTNRFSARANADFYRHRLVQEGWRIDGEKEPNIDRENSQTIFFSQDGRELTLTISERAGQQGTTVVASMVTESDEKL